jgi:hypothetical protein
MLRTPPGEFLADLRDNAGVRVSVIDETTLDGRPALRARLPGIGGVDLHVGQMSGLSSPHVLLGLPSQLTVAEIDGTTIFIYVWARNDRELAEWLPAAEEFIASIDFVEE